MLPPIVVIPFAYFTQAVLGFGGGIISIAILGHIIGIEEAVLLVLPFDFLLATLLFGCWQKIRWNLAIPIGVGVVIGTFIGMWMFQALPERGLRIFFGLSVLLFLAKDFLHTPSIRKSNILSVVIGILSGMMQGVGVGGPVLILYFLGHHLEKHAFRATLIFLFFVSNIFRVLIAVNTGLLTSDLLLQAGNILPWFFAALIAGHFCISKIPEKIYLNCVRTLLFVSVILLMIR